jgi:hypothetical protein
MAAVRITMREAGRRVRYNDRMARAGGGSFGLGSKGGLGTSRVSGRAGERVFSKAAGSGKMKFSAGLGGAW